MGKAATLRGALGETLGHLNGLTRGGFLACAADLAESTSVAAINKGFAKGWWQAARNPGSRLVPVGGICEDAMGGVVSGISSLGLHVGVSSSYSAFIAPLEHVPARLHCIGQQMRHEATGEPNRTMIMVNAPPAPMTGEDEPTARLRVAAAELLQDNFAPGASITLTPWDPQEMWPLMIAALNARPALIMRRSSRVRRPRARPREAGVPARPRRRERRLCPAPPGGKAAVVLQGHGA